MRKLITVVLFLMSTAVLSAAPPRNWAYLDKKPKGFRPCGVVSGETAQKLQKKGVIRKAGKKGVIAATTYKVLAIRVHFSAGTPISAASDTVGFFSKLRDYYAENSYGLLTVTATITANDYTLPSTILSYGDETDSALVKLITDTVNASKNDYDFSLYDHVMIYHAGYGEEESDSSTDLWSLFYDYSYSVDGKTFNGFTVVPELAASGVSPLGVICHEYGHQLGLPDLYDTTVSGGRSTCGAWSLMDYPYGADNSGKNPPHLDPWCKNYLKFIDLSSREVNTSVSSLAMSDIETSQTAGFVKIPADTSSSEYFIAELRAPDSTRIQYDLSTPLSTTGKGVLVWHIDDSIALDPARLVMNNINSGSPNLGVDVVEADLNTVYPPGKAASVYGTNSAFSSPQSDTFSGVQTSISVANILISGFSATVSVIKLASSSALDVARLINYPNPSGPGYAHPRSASGVLTTLVFNFSRVPQSLEADIFDLAGWKVKTIAKDKLSFRVAPSADYKWVYEYDWDGKNDSGENVAQGIYLYRINADGKIKTGKLAIVR
ncbi:MAG TPA: hypothetical protein DEE98_05530 [Elusimicrobia bacterium]|nr:hypothetical protein [Elusimicrobiota bacterium]